MLLGNLTLNRINKTLFVALFAVEKVAIAALMKGGGSSDIAYFPSIKTKCVVAALIILQKKRVSGI